MVAAVVFLLLGFAVRKAEFNQLGSTNNASLWVFAFSGLCLYTAVLLAWTAFRRQQRKKRR